ncbi:ABC transporter related protein [Truepera radiovictrix DSM 17093]|uniref:ABC transporter related protein n=2 Tax=Truepera TaxID=332248 RepID=D7CSG3_TRURR|nr:ABC transporter ATP-binding protein [Truepera radiovictrix]ADI15383.1 ABC transporter related protein [Truepera radiovictrix DSM 17093]WMT56066.1 ABC transporter ATP-binding protein [Truepera radiovictrix]
MPSAPPRVVADAPRTPHTTHAPLAVSMQGIVKRFPLVLANDHVTFEVAWGEVHALIGENGAGKSTLMKILGGVQEPDEGQIIVDGQRVRVASAKDAFKLGIGMVHQHFMLIEPLSVTENLVLGAEPHLGPSLDLRTARRKTRELITRFGFDIDPDARIESLPVGLQQQVEILKTLYRGARILIMDEPTAVLTPQETRGLFAFIREFAAAGNAVVFISHKLDEVMAICDRMSVMRDGKMIGTVRREETDQRRLANMMVGREVLLRVDKRPATPKEVRLEVRNVTLRNPGKDKPVLQNVSFSLRAGEILGVAGIEGNGQSELVESLTGLRAVDEGQILINGRDLTREGARRVREAGVSHIPEDRNERGLVGPFSAAMNSVLGDAYRPPFSRFGFLQEGAIRAHAERLIRAYDVRPASTEVSAQSYSGGNAQKLIVARELERGPQILIASQPTRGVDIGAIEFIHKQIVAARDRGLAVLLVSADLSEVMSLSDRILVLFEGQVMGELTQEEATAERLGLMMAGSKGGEGGEPDAVARGYEGAARELHE